MSNVDLIKALTKFATADLALARKHRLIGVAQTKLGTLDVEYTSGVYTISANGTVLALGVARIARAFLVATYNVVLA